MKIDLDLTPEQAAVLVQMFAAGEMDECGVLDVTIGLRSTDSVLPMLGTSRASADTGQAVLPAAGRSRASYGAYQGQSVSAPMPGQECTDEISSQSTGMPLNFASYQAIVVGRVSDQEVALATQPEDPGLFEVLVLDNAAGYSRKGYILLGTLRPEELKKVLSYQKGQIVNVRPLHDMGDLLIVSQSK